jgi:putative hydrolase of the HAD superfamily
VSGVEAVLFDVDDTLVEYRRSTAELLDVAFGEAGIEPFFEVEAYLDRYPEYADASDGMRDLRRRCFEAIAEERGYDPELGTTVAETYAAERDHSNVRPLPGAGKTVDRLREGHRLGVVTNGAPEMQRQKLEAVGLHDSFETVVHAGYDAPAKPDPEPFERALRDLGARPERAVHVGNSLSSDVAGAHAAGVRSTWLSDGREPDPEPHHVVESLHELHEPPWLEE